MLFFVLFLSIKNLAGGGVLHESHQWISSLGITYSLLIDGFSAAMIIITIFLSIIAIIIGWNALDRWYVFGALLFLMQFGIIGVFLAEDLMLFYIFWEIMLFPMYFMIAFWGGKEAKKAANQFLLFTFVASLFMLIGIIALYFMKSHNSIKFVSFAFSEFQNISLNSNSKWILLSLLIGLGVKVPLFPLHVWAPKAYKESNPIVTILLSGVMANAGVYGILRVVLYIFPEGMVCFSKIGMGLAAIGTIYSAILAYNQNNISSVAAYCSISHMNLSLLAVFSLQVQAVNGAVLQLMAHSISIAGIFSVVSILEQRGYCGDLDKISGLFKPMPKLGVYFLFFVIASVGLPGLGNFAAEIMILAGSFQVSAFWGIIACFSIALSIAYFLKMYERSMLGPLKYDKQNNKIIDLNSREWGVLFILSITLIWLGIYPQMFINSIMDGLSHIPSINEIGKWRIG